MDATAKAEGSRRRADSMQPSNEFSTKALVEGNFGKSPEMKHNCSQDVDRASSKTPKSENLLLRLPPELRNKIYNQVLGGKIFKFKSTVACKHARLDTAERHTLGLLYTCRLIYTETALLPYMLNTFSFRDLDISLYPFLRQRSPAQFRSIQALELVTSKAMRMWAESRDFSTNLVDEMRIIGPLPNLRYIRVLIDTVASLYLDASSSDYPDFNITWEHMRLLDSWIYKHRPDVIVNFRVVQDLGVGVGSLEGLR